MIYLFHSIRFLVFFAPILLIHWLLPKRFRNACLLAASYFFYATWDFRFLALLLVSTGLTFACALAMERETRGSRRRFYFLTALFVNLGSLGFFKFWNFFSEPFRGLAARFGMSLPPVIDVLLPLGISFYTFQVVGYAIDVYRRKIRAERDLVDFSLFVVYFPQLLAGPIEKAADLIPQFKQDRRWSEVRYQEALYLYVYGLFRKIVFADSLGVLVTRVFSDPHPSGAQMLIGLYAFAFQLYFDFSAYTDMARGISALFGIRLSTNFNLPFFANGYFDFYRRWHITLCRWIAENVYLPLYFWLPRVVFRAVPGTAARLYLGGFFALLVTRMVFALWHGATWNFVALGFYIFAVQLLTALARRGMRLVPEGFGERFQPALAVLRILVTFHLFCFAMLFFRSTSPSEAFRLAGTLFSGISPAGLWQGEYAVLYWAAAFLGIYETLQYRLGDTLFLCRKNFYLQLAFYLLLFFMYLQIGTVSDQRFIYFRF